MTYKQQLTDLLCTEKLVDEQIRELKFGCRIKINRYNFIYDFIDIDEIVVYDIVFDGKNIFSINGIRIGGKNLKKFNGVKEIIGNPIEYHHLMMYCKEKNFGFIISKSEINIRNKKGFLSFEIEFDNTKPLSEQSEEVYENILIALKGLSN